MKYFKQLAIFILLPGLSLHFFSSSALGQPAEYISKNFTGAVISMDVNGSFLAGIEYERYLPVVNRVVFGLRGNLYNPYKSGKSLLSSGDGYKISVIQGWATVHYFTSDRKRRYAGFNISAAAGVTYHLAKKYISTVTGNDKYSSFLGGAELGIGTQGYIADRTMLGFRTTVSISSAPQPRGTSHDEQAFALISIKFFVGF